MAYYNYIECRNMEFSHLIGCDESIQSLYPCTELVKKTIVRNEENNKYIVFNTRAEFERWYNSQGTKCFHEVIFGNRVQRLKFDIDIKEKKDYNIHTVIDHILDTIIQTINDLYYCIDDVNLSRSDFIITDSSGPINDNEYKHSFHIILYKYAVMNNEEAKNITADVVQKCCKLYRHYIDKAVNKSIQNFRILGSTKYRSERVKKVTLEYDTYDGSLLDTLIASPTNVTVLSELLDSQDQDSEFGDSQDQGSQDTINSDCISSKLLDSILKKCKAMNVIDGHKVRCVRNNSIQFNRTRPTFCVICSEIHHNDNSLIINYDNLTSNIYEFCRQANESRILCNLHKVCKEIDLNKQNDYSCKFDKLLDKHIYNDSKMKPYEFVSNLAVKAQMKVGKTKALHDYVSTNYNNESIIRFVTFRQTFSNHVYTMFNDFDLYSNIKGSICNDEHKRVIIQVESLYRLELEPSTSIDLLILDESESIFSQLGSGLHKNFNASFAMFIWMLTHAKHVICMDANLSDRTYNILTKFRDDPIFFHHNKYQPSLEDTYYVTTSKNTWINQLCDKISNDKKVVVATNSIKEAKTCEYLITTMYPTRVVKIYSSEMKYSEKQLSFSNVHKYWSELDVLIYTPTCSAGISYELKHFDVIFGYFCNMSCDVETCRQMLNRVRNVVDHEYYICLQESETVQLPTSSSELHNYLYNKRMIMFQFVKDNNLQYSYDVDGNIKFYETDYYHVWLENMAINNLSKNDFISRFIGQIRQTGSKIKTMQDLECNIIHTEHNDAKKFIEDQQNAIVANSRDITIEEANDIINKIGTQQDVEIDDFHAYEKYKLKNYYSYTQEIDSDFVKYYNKQHVKQVFKNLTDITRYDSIEESIKYIITTENNRYGTTVTNESMYRNKLEYYDLRDDRHVYNSLSHVVVSGLITKFGTSALSTEEFNDILEHVWTTIDKYKTELSIEHNINFDKTRQSVINSLLQAVYGLRFYKVGNTFRLKKCNGLATLFTFKSKDVIQFESRKVTIITNSVLFLSLEK
jgi:hypothetical protein